MSKDSDVMYAATEPNALDQMQLAAGPDNNVILAHAEGESDEKKLDKQKKDFSLLNALEGIVKMPYKTVLGLASGISETVSDPDKMREVMNDPRFQIGMRMIQESGTPSFASPFARLAKSVTDTGTYLDSVDAEAAELALKNDKSKTYKPETNIIDSEQALAVPDITTFIDSNELLKSTIEVYKKANVPYQFNVSTQSGNRSDGEPYTDIYDITLAAKEGKYQFKTMSYQVKQSDNELLAQGFKEGERGTIGYLVNTEANNISESGIVGYNYDTFVKDKPVANTNVEVLNTIETGGDVLDNLESLQKIMQNSSDYKSTESWNTTLNENSESRGQVSNTIDFQINQAISTEGEIDFGKSKESLLPLTLFAKSLLNEEDAANVAAMLGFKNIEAVDNLEAIKDIGNSLTVSVAKEVYPVSNKDIEFLKAQFANIGQTNDSFFNISSFHKAQNTYLKLLQGEVENFRKESKYNFPEGTQVEGVVKGLNGELITSKDAEVKYTDRNGIDKSFRNAKSYAEYVVADKLLADLNENEDLQKRLDITPYIKEKVLGGNAASNEETYSVMSILTAKEMNTPLGKKLEEKIILKNKKDGKNIQLPFLDTPTFKYPDSYDELVTEEGYAQGALKALQLEGERLEILGMEDGQEKDDAIVFFIKKLGYPQFDINRSIKQQYIYLNGKAK